MPPRQTTTSSAAYPLRRFDQSFFSNQTDTGDNFPLPSLPNGARCPPAPSLASASDSCWAKRPAPSAHGFPLRHLQPKADLLLRNRTWCAHLRARLACEPGNEKPLRRCKPGQARWCFCSRDQTAPIFPQSNGFRPLRTARSLASRYPEPPSLRIFRSQKSAPFPF